LPDITTNFYGAVIVLYDWKPTRAVNPAV